MNLAIRATSHNLRTANQPPVGSVAAAQPVYYASQLFLSSNQQHASTWLSLPWYFGDTKAKYIAQLEWC
jgi:hypothetical protein